MMIRGRIYCVTCLPTGKLYFGQTVKSIYSRFNLHLICARKGSHYKFHRAIRKYGVENFTVEEVMWVEAPTKQALKAKLDFLEIHFIQKFDTRRNGYNSTDGGEGKLGYIVSEETRNKISFSNQCKVRSKETCQKISEAQRKRTKQPHKGVAMTSWNKQVLLETHLGIPMKEETKNKISRALKGRKLSDETRRKMSLSRKKQNSKIN